MYCTYNDMGLKRNHLNIIFGGADLVVNGASPAATLRVCYTVVPLGACTFQCLDKSGPPALFLQ